MALMHGAKAGEHICKALGLNPQKIRSIEITLEPDSAARVRIEGWLSIEDVSSLGDTFRQFRMRGTDKPYFCDHDLIPELYLPDDHHHNGEVCKGLCPGGCVNHFQDEDHNELCKLI